MTAANYLYEIKNLLLQRDNKTLFNNLTLNIANNDRLLVTGKNGSGKTTLCNILTGLCKKHLGDIYLKGNSLKDIKTFLIAAQVTYLQQNPETSVVGINAREDLEIWKFGFKKIKRNTPDFREFETTIEKAFIDYGLSEIKEKPVWELSRGEIRKISLCSLRLNPAKFWMLDEPFNGLDKMAATTLTNDIQNHVSGGYGILVVTHEPDYFRNMDFRIIEL